MVSVCERGLKFNPCSSLLATSRGRSCWLFSISAGVAGCVGDVVLRTFALKSSNVQNLLKLLSELDYGNLMPEMKKKIIIIINK